jgi:ABC-type spermidine/putrescine transport system permease subunit II
MSAWHLLALVPIAFLVSVAAAAGWHGGCILGAMMFGARVTSSSSNVVLPATLPSIRVTIEEPNP